MRAFASLIVLLVFCSAAHAAVLPDACRDEKGVKIIVPQLNCLSDEPDGHFAAPAEYKPQCKIMGAGWWARIKTSDDSEFRLSIPLSLMGVTNAGDKVAFVEVDVDVLRDSPYSCGTKTLAAQIKVLEEMRKNDAKLYKSYEENQEGYFEIKELSEGMLGSSMCDKAGCKFTPFTSKRKIGGENRVFDLFYKTDKNKTPVYIVSCLPWNNSCVADASGLADGRFRYSVSFSAEHEAEVFKIMDGVAPILDGMYIKKTAAE